MCEKKLTFVQEYDTLNSAYIFILLIETKAEPDEIGLKIEIPKKKVCSLQN